MWEGHWHPDAFWFAFRGYGLIFATPNAPEIAKTPLINLRGWRVVTLKPRTHP